MRLLFGGLINVVLYLQHWHEIVSSRMHSDMIPEELGVGIVSFAETPAVSSCFLSGLSLLVSVNFCGTTKLTNLTSLSGSLKDEAVFGADFLRLLEQLLLTTRDDGFDVVAMSEFLIKFNFLIKQAIFKSVKLKSNLYFI